MEKSLKLFLKLKLVLVMMVIVNCSNSFKEDRGETYSSKINLERIKSKADEAKKYCRINNFNQDFFILIDLGRHSGLKRFFVWDFKKNLVAESYLVSHGSCDNPWGMDLSKDNAKTSNVNNSHCSSSGKYAIGERGYSAWGIRVKYLLHGLEPSNSNATKRDIVFHSWEQVSDKEVYPKGTPEGWGCPAISNSAMRAVDKRLQGSGKKVLMWVIR